MCSHAIQLSATGSAERGIPEKSGSAIYPALPGDVAINLTGWRWPEIRLLARFLWHTGDLLSVYCIWHVSEREMP